MRTKIAKKLRRPLLLKNSEVRFFGQKPSTPITYSADCQRANEFHFNKWMFQVIKLYQRDNQIEQQSFQRWSFIKFQNEIQIICLDSKGNTLLLTSFSAQFLSLGCFQDQNFCIIDKYCSTISEMNLLLNSSLIHTYTRAHAQ